VDTQNLWPHQGTLGTWGFAPYETDDASNTPGIATTRVDSYFLAAALHCDGTMDPIGTFCHEFGHALDIRDLYDLSPWPDANGEGLGHWCLMARGN
jgi:M6 family metalloprotease-like protein